MLEEYSRINTRHQAPSNNKQPIAAHPRLRAFSLSTYMTRASPVASENQHCQRRPTMAMPLTYGHPFIQLPCAPSATALCAHLLCVRVQTLAQRALCSHRSRAACVHRASLCAHTSPSTPAKSVDFSILTKIFSHFSKIHSLRAPSRLRLQMSAIYQNNPMS